MTSTEAIDVFVRFVEMKEGKENGVVAPHDVFIDACKLAISALQGRPIKTLQKPRECRNKNCVAMCSPAWAEFWFDKSDCPNYVRGEDRPIGHWKIYQSSNRNVIACSCCKQPIYDPQMNYYYCPNCGAKMETQNIV